MSLRQVKRLSEEMKAKLREEVKKFETQTHFLTFNWGKPGHYESAREALDRAALESQLLARLYSWADPIPRRYEFASGIVHYNDSPDYHDFPWEVVRAIASRKVHYLAKIRREHEQAPHEVPRS